MISHLRNVRKISSFSITVKMFILYFVIGNYVTYGRSE